MTFPLDTLARITKAEARVPEQQSESQQWLNSAARSGL